MSTPAEPGAGTAIRLLAVVTILAGCLAGAPVRAQRADQNAVTAAQDAFGTSAGNQTIGLYSMTDARGFNPQQAGNLRIEGLYFDQPSQYVNQCLAPGTTMRIGIAAQSYSFPSPTGIADLKLNSPAATAGASAVLTRGPYQEAGVLIEGQTPLSGRLAVSGCADIGKGFLADFARHSDNVGLATVFRWRPTDHTEIVPFWSYAIGGAHAILPTVYTDGALPPPLFDIRRLASQDLTSQGWRTTTVGAILRERFTAEWTLTAGIFRSIEQDPRSFTEEYLSVLPDRSADHVLDVVPAVSATSTSGELRLSRRFGGGVHERKLELAVRGRRVNRDFGGDALVDYGTISLEDGPPPAQTAFATSATSLDETRQTDVGIVFEERWKGVGSVAVGFLRSNYRRTILDPGAAPSSGTASPWLSNFRVTLEPTKSLTFYGSLVQGLEDSALAPTIATNRGEPPPATRTRQVDAGLRYAPAEKVSVILGAFDIEKVYFNLDAANLYTALGTIRHRGLESSLNYADGGLTVVAGGVLLRQHVDRRLPEPGATGFASLGPVPLVLDLNLDYAPSRLHPWAGSIQWTRLSERVATADDRYWLPPLAMLSLGLRYESKLRRHPLTVRFDAANVTDARGLHLTQVGQVIPELGRRFALTIAIDN